MDLTALLTLIDRTFNLEEVRTLCFGLAIDYDNLGGEGKQAKVRELILKLYRLHRLPDLVDAVAAARPYGPDVDWGEARKEIIAFQETSPDLSDPFAVAMVPAPFQAPRRIPHFTGRLSLLSQVADLLQQAEGITSIVGLVGIGGAGKTSLAAEIVYRL